jgi:hypothetical protein
MASGTDPSSSGQNGSAPYLSGLGCLQAVDTTAGSWARLRGFRRFAARVLGMHRRTLVRTLRMNIDIRALRNVERRPPGRIGMQQHKQIAG